MLRDFHKLIPFVPVLFPSFPFFLLLPCQRCKKVSTLLSKTNSTINLLIHLLHTHLTTTILLPGQMFHNTIKVFLSSQVDLGAALSYCICTNLRFLIVLQLFTCMRGQKLKAIWDKKACIFMFLSPATRTMPNIQYLFHEFHVKVY